MSAHNMLRLCLAFILASANLAPAAAAVRAAAPVVSAPGASAASAAGAAGSSLHLGQPGLSALPSLNFSAAPSLSLPQAQFNAAGSVQPAAAASANPSARPSVSAAGAEFQGRAPALNAAAASAQPGLSLPAAALNAAAAPSGRAAGSVQAAGSEISGRSAAEKPSYGEAAAKSQAAASAAALLNGREAASAKTLGLFFDAAKKAGETDVDGADFTAPEDGPTEFKPSEQEDTLDLWVGRTTQGKLFDSKVSASIRMINNEKSEWFWGKYQRELPVRVVAGTKMLFVTRIVDAETKPVSELTLEDLKAYYGSSAARSKEGESEAKLVARLKERLLGELKYKAGMKAGAPKVISEDTRVRVLHFLPYKQAQSLPENNVEAAPEIRPRKTVNVPEILKPLHRMLPRLVLIDLKLLGDRIPWDLLEDMGKLQKAGMTFVLLSDKSQEEVDKMIERGMTLKQKDDLTRWKMLSLSNDGNTLYGYSGAFPKLKVSRSFQRHELEILRHAAGAAAPEGAVVEDRSYGLTLRAKRGVKIEDLEAALARQLERFGMPAGSYAITRQEVDGHPAVRVRPTTMDRALGQLLTDLQNVEGIYLNGEHVLAVSENPAVKRALPDSLHATDHLGASAREDYVETVLAALLGPYRENRQGDLAASASSIKSFKAKRFEQGGGGNRIYMLLGHVAHTAFDWLVMDYKNTGKLASFETLWAKALEVWEREHIAETVNLLEYSRERTLGYRDAMEARMKAMYLELERTLQLYPIALGTELPNLMVVDRYDAHGQPAHRDIFRGLYDVVLARRAADGLEVLVGDFKTGQTPALQHMAKDVQVLLYDFFSRSMWDTLALPYTVTAQIEKVARRVVGFIYPRGMQGVSIGEFERLPFEIFLYNIMQRTRKHKGVLTEDMINREMIRARRQAAKAEKEKKAAEKGAKKKPAKKK